MTAAITIINRTRHTVIIRRSRHRLLAVELTARFASTDSGKAGNASGGGAFPSILFKALRIELNGILLQTCGVYSIPKKNSDFFKALHVEDARYIFRRLPGQVRHIKRMFFTIENNFGQWSDKSIHRDTVFCLHRFHSTAGPAVVFFIYFDIAEAQLI